MSGAEVKIPMFRHHIFKDVLLHEYEDLERGVSVTIHDTNRNWQIDSTEEFVICTSGQCHTFYGDASDFVSKKNVRLYNALLFVSKSSFTKAFPLIQKGLKTLPMRVMDGDVAGADQSFIYGKLRKIGAFSLALFDTNTDTFADMLVYTYCDSLSLIERAYIVSAGRYVNSIKDVEFAYSEPNSEFYKEYLLPAEYRPVN